MNFKIYTLEQLATIKYGKNQKNVVSDTGTIPIYGTGGLMGYATRALYDKPSVLIGRKGSIEKVRYTEYPFWTVDTLFYTVVNEDIIFPQYLYYLLSLVDLKLYNEGTTIPSLRTETLNRIKFNVPNKIIQKKILEILRPIENKIENNQKINDNLQQQAQALYENIFISFPDATTTSGTLSDIATITMGQSPSGSSYNEDAVGEVFYQGRAEFGFRFPTRHLYTTEPKKLAEAGDVLLSVRAPVGDLNVAYERCCIGRGLGAIHSKNGNSSFILYTMFALKPQLDIFNGEGTVFGSINRDALNAIPFKVPAADKISQFETLVRPMDDMIRSNYEEIIRLEKLRNSLLPKLISGEIDVSGI